MFSSFFVMYDIKVALYTSAWIEISQRLLKGVPEELSHSTRVRGLKFSQTLTRPTV